MATTMMMNGNELMAWLDKNQHQLVKGNKAQNGDIVVCSVRNNYGEPCDMGKIHFKNHPNVQSKLPAGHEDGDVGDMFVHTYCKRRVNKRKKIQSKLRA